MYEDLQMVKVYEISLPLMKHFGIVIKWLSLFQVMNWLTFMHYLSHWGITFNKIWSAFLYAIQTEITYK